MEELEGILRVLLGASVQVSGAGKGRVQLWAQGWRDALWHQSHHPLLVPCSVSTGNCSSATSRASAWRFRVSWLLPSRRYDDLGCPPGHPAPFFFG